MDDNEYLALLAEGGFMVQKISTLLCPEGRKIPFDAVPEKAAADTVRALQADRVTLFKATLISNGKLARIDIMRKRGNEFHLIEVKATSFDSDEHAAAVAEGRPSLFRTKRVESIVAGWRDHLEDVAFQVLVPRELFPQATIQPYLLMPDTSKSTPIDRLHSLFRLHRRLVPGSRQELFEVEFTGDTDAIEFLGDASALMSDHSQRADAAGLRAA